MVVAASSASAAVVSKKGASALLKSSGFRWAVGGWTFFIAENTILSENRTYLIEQLGDGNYHAVYGTLSTAATISIAYSYYYLTKKLPLIKTGGMSTSAAMASAEWLTKTSLVASWTSLTMGLIMASQALPKMQIPVSSSFEVRCPFDFTDKRLNGDGSETTLYGLERITRHPGLWSLAFVFAGNAFLQSPANVPLRAWWLGPTAVAWIGGMHTDSRYRRGMGGHLDPYYDSMTSNTPFLAMFTGRQGSVGQSVNDLANEIKPLNAGIAALAATVWVATRGRVKMP